MIYVYIYINLSYTYDTWLLPRNYIVTLVSLGTFDTKQSDKNCKIHPPTSEQFFY